MEKMKQISAWMRIMAVMLAFVMGITMMPLDTFAAAGKDSGAYLKGSEEAADEFMTDKAYLAESGHSHDNCGCSECYDHEDCNCDGCGDNDVCDCEERNRYDTSIGNDRITPDGAACYHENIEYEEGDCWFHYIVCQDCGEKFLENHSGPYYGQDGTCACGLKVHNYGGYGDTYRTFAHEWGSYTSKGDLLHTKTCTKCGTSWVEEHGYENDTCVCGRVKKDDECHHYAYWSTAGPESFVNIDCATHSFICDNCGERVIDLHGLAFDTDGKHYCKCHAEVGASGPTYHNAHKYEYVSVNDEIHQYVCSKCGYVHIKSPHHFGNGNICSDCGYEGQNTIATPPTAKTGLVYNAKIQTGVEAGTGYTLTGNTAKDAGDYTAIARLEDGYTWTDGSTDGKTIEWSIAPAELTEVTLTETVFYYNGEVQRPDVTEVKAGDLIVPSEDYTVVYEGGDTKDPGTYRVLVRKEFGKNNVTGGVWATYEIKKGAVPPTAKTDLVYNGKIQIGIEEAETSWIGYKVVGYTEKNAGDYIATATLDEGYIWTDGTTDPKNIKWSIAPAPLIEIVLSETTLVYDGTVQKPDITSVLSETIPALATDYEIEWSNENSKDIGIYAVKAEGKGNFKGVVTATYEISLLVTPPTAKADLVYNGKEQTGVDSGKGYKIKDNTGTDAGDYKATATLESGYTWTDGTTDDKEISWSIEAAELTSVGVTKTLYFYDGNVHKPDVTVVRAGAITVPDTDYSLSWSNENSQEVGFYTVEATATSKNYTGTATATYEISDGIAKVPTAKTGLVYKGWTLTGVEPGTGYTLRDNTGETAGNYIATATLEDGFEWDDGSKTPKTIPWSIAQAPITGMTLSERTFTYNGSVQRPGVTSVHAGNIRLKRIDYTISWSDENSKDVGIYTVTVRGTENFTGVITRKYVIESMENWNLFEDGSEHVYTVSGITSKNEAANSNTSSAKYFTAVLSKDKITVNLKEGADRKKAAAANVFDFDLGEEGAVSYTLPLTYNKPVLKLSSSGGTVKKGTETTLKTTVLCQNEDGNFEPYDLSEAVVSYGRQTLDGGADGVVAIVASSKASDSIKISKEGWNENDPIALKYTISEAAADKDVLEADLNGIKQVILNTNNPEQSFTFPLTLNGEDASAETVEIVKGKKGEENLAQIGNGIVTVSLGKSGIGKGSYTITLKPVKESKARATIKVKVTDKAMTASGKIALKMDVVTKKPMIVIPTLKEGSGQITDAEVTGITLKKGTPKPASSFAAEVKGSYIEVSYTGSEEMKASDLKIGDMTLMLTVIDSEGAEAKVPLTIKSVTAKKTTPAVRSGKVVIPKALAEKADGSTVIATANILSTYVDSAKHTQTITPADVKLVPKNVEAVRDESDYSRILIKKLTGKSGSVKATLTYAGGVTKTVTIKVVNGK